MKYRYLLALLPVTAYAEDAPKPQMTVQQSAALVRVDIEDRVRLLADALVSCSQPKSDAASAQNADRLQRLERDLVIAQGRQKQAEDTLAVKEKERDAEVEESNEAKRLYREQFFTLEKPQHSTEPTPPK